MKRILALIALATILLSCGSTPALPDPADDFAGYYTYTDSYFLRWGSDSKTSTLNAEFTLTKTGPNTVQMDGAWSTTGTITGNIITFSPCTENDSEGSIRYTFGMGSLAGRTLIFTYKGTGSRRFTNGISYPWETSGNVTAMRIQ